MDELALYAGAGGGLLGSILLGHRPVAAVEIDPYCREVLLRRQRDGVLPLFPIWDDVRTFDGRPWHGLVDVVSAGFPCPPFSVAGKRRGEDDERNLWPETIRVIREVAPEWVFLENVPGLLAHGYFGRIIGDLATSGYVGSWDCIPASSVGAPHQRDRLWILAHADSGRREVEREQEPRGIAGSRRDEPDRRSEGRTAPAMADADSIGWRGRGEAAGRAAGPESEGSDRAQPDAPGADALGQRLEGIGKGRTEAGTADRSGDGSDPSWWSAEPGVRRVVDGLAHRVDRLRALGNGQVPRVVERAWKELMK